MTYRSPDGRIRFTPYRPSPTAPYTRFYRRLITLMLDALNVHLVIVLVIIIMLVLEVL